jgi:hypothetical protein
VRHYDIRPEDVGRAWIVGLDGPARAVSIQSVLGIIRAEDVGRRLYLVDDPADVVSPHRPAGCLPRRIVVAESDRQRARRLGLDTGASS